MANLKSSKKDLRRIAKRTEKNRSTKSALKTLIKKAKSSEETARKESFEKAIKALDKAVQNGVIHKNQAARRKSRLALAINKLAAK